MGFFDSLMGGSKSSSSSGGFNQLPEEIQSPYKNFGTNIDAILKGGNLSKYYTPTPLSSGENKAIDSLYKGYTPDSAQLGKDLEMQMNPYDSYVIDEINRQGAGDFSVLKQQMNQTGQVGSNRGILGANDIDLTRMNQIGTFKQSQYNKALDNALNLLPNSRRQDAAGALSAGDYSRTVDAGTNAAPITALQQLAQALGILPTAEGSSTSSSSSSKGIGDIAQAAAAGYAKSDIRLKENIVRVGDEKGFPIYEFNYKTEPKRYRGVMAQDVKKIRPDAVVWEDGFMHVNYNKLGIMFREV